MRWKTTVVGLMAALAFAVGCKQQCFLYECDRNATYAGLGLSPRLEDDPTPSIVPATGTVGKPATIDDAERPPRYLSLAEAFAMALENGDPGTSSIGQAPYFLGTVIDDPSVLSRAGVGIGARQVSSANNIRVLSLFPALVGPDIEISLSKFDVRWTSSMTWNTTDQPTQGLSSFSNGDTAAFDTGLFKPLPTGGIAGITFNTTYTNLTTPPSGFITVNPRYEPKLQFQFEQPLLQGYGVEINQLRDNHPNSILSPNLNLALQHPVEGILITRIRLDEERLEFERQIHQMLVNVETAYWNLYASYWALYSREQAMRQAFEAWKINKARYEAGRISIEDFAQTRGQYELFRGQRLAALDDVLEKEHQLRALIGLPIEDGSRLVPIDTPTLTPYEPDWNTALNECLALRPGLGMARQDLKFRQLDLILQKNSLLPDLRFLSTYAPNGLGSTLDGSKSSLLPANPTNPNSAPVFANAFRTLATGDFVNWSLGLRLDVPLGYREAHAAVRQSRLSLATSYLILRDTETRYTRFLEEQYRSIFSTYAQIISQRAQREAAAQQLEARNKQFQAGKGTLDFLLEAQRLWADALRAEYQAVADYNNALTRFEYAKGTIMQRDNIVIAEGGLPQCAQVRAVEHERERSNALVLRERAKPITVPCCRFEGGTLLGLPELPKSTAPSIPALFEGQAGLEKPPGQLPSVPGPAAGQGPSQAIETAPQSESRRPELTPSGLMPPVRETDAKPIIGMPTPAMQGPKSEEKNEPGAYQIPEMAAATAPVLTPKPTLAPPVLTASSNAPEPVITEEPTKWSHPERLQRTRWRESLGDSAEPHAN
jgi:outer membrane protein TolC